MKIGVVGPGAVGSFFAATLADAGADVVLIDHRPARAEALNRSGITLLGDSSDRTVSLPVTTADALHHSLDLALFLVKAFDTDAAAAAMVPRLPRGAIALTLQNGLGNAEALAAALPGRRILAGSTALGVTAERPGRVRFTGAGPTVIGPTIGAARADCEPVAAILASAGISTDVTADPMRAIWEKAAINAAINPLTAILQVCNGALADSAVAQQVMRWVIEETAAAAAKAGVHLDPTKSRANAVAVCQNTAGNRSSMLQDLLSGKRTEIEQINGAVVRRSAAAGRFAPANQVLVSMVTGLSDR